MGNEEDSLHLSVKKGRYNGEDPNAGKDGENEKDNQQQGVCTQLLWQWVHHWDT